MSSLEPTIGNKVQDGHYGGGRVQTPPISPIRHKRGLYAEARIGSTVYVYAIEPFPDTAHWLIRTYAALANILGVNEVTVFYRSRKIRDGVIAPLDLA